MPSVCRTVETSDEMLETRRHSFTECLLANIQDYEAGEQRIMLPT